MLATNDVVSIIRSIELLIHVTDKLLFVVSEPIITSNTWYVCTSVQVVTHDNHRDEVVITNPRIVEVISVSGNWKD